jgi:hypothetical protein
MDSERFALMPRTSLKGKDSELEDFSAQVQLSSCYETFDENFNGVDIVG